MASHDPVTRAAELRYDRFRQAFKRVAAEVQQAVVGYADEVENALIAFCGGGHVLIEGVPGLGKTRLVRALAAALGLPHSRIQCTPDLLPADITGTVTLLETSTGGSTLGFRRGPVFANVVHVDEINRATPRTQAALLEAMQERAVTVGETTHSLPLPFFVAATQNPIEMEGTFPLPEAELDRFFFKLVLSFPPTSLVVEILKLTTAPSDVTITPAVDEEELAELTRACREILVAESVYRRAARLVQLTHPDADGAPTLVRRAVRFGASPRAAQALILGGKVKALLAGRYNVAYRDLEAVARPALRHRVLLTLDAESDGIRADSVVDAAVAAAAGEA